MNHFHRQSAMRTQAGFSLVELIVSLALFSVVVTISVGALLMLIAANDQLQKEQSVMTNLSFALDSMTREMRTGIHYYCESQSVANAGGLGSIYRPGNSVDLLDYDDTKDCPMSRNGGGSGNGAFHGVAFIEAGDSITGTGERILYYHERGTGKIFRKVGAETPQSIVSSGIYIENIEFYVTGSVPLSDNPSEDDQATVTVVITARDADDDSADDADSSSKKYQIQTTITQRTLDI